MKLVTWNLNSIRARTDRLFAWLEKERPDVLCLQETKVEDAGFPTEAVRKAGYEVVTFGQRSYNGVAILSTQPLTDVSREFGDGQDDGDARVIAATTHGIRVVCVYVPNGQELASDRYPYKLAWLRRLRAYLERTAKPSDPLVLCGDMNVTPDDRDVWAPDKWRDQIHCSQPERDALAEVAGFGLVDLFREKNGDARCGRGGTTAASRSSRTRACASTSSSVRARSPIVRRRSRSIATRARVRTPATTRPSSR